MSRPIRPPNWREAHLVGLIQPVRRDAVVGDVHVRVVSVLADQRRTYVELKWKSPHLRASMFVERAELFDPLERPIERRSDLDAGAGAERFLCFGAVPNNAPLVTLKLYPKEGGDPTVLPLSLESRLRGRGAFNLAVGSALMLASRRLEIISYRGGVTEGAVTFRLQAGACNWPVAVSGFLSTHLGTDRKPVQAEGVPDEAGRLLGELVVEAPDPLHQTLSVQEVRGLPLPEPLRLECAAGRHKMPLRLPDLGQTTLESLYETLDGEWRLRLRMPHMGVTSSTSLVEFTQVRSAGETTQVQAWPAGTEMLLQGKSPTAQCAIELDGFVLRFDPPPTVRLARG